MSQQLHVVTGAFGYSGQYITRRLLAAGHRVRTLTDSPDRENPFGDQVQAHPFHWDQPDELAASLRGATVLYNTYWVRFNHRTFQHSVAVDHTLTLFEAAQRAGVERVVHTSITNPSEDSPLEYFAGKAVLERALAESGLSHAVLRPAVLFGDEDILINNIAWTLRKLPVFGVFGRGDYRLQPIHVDDFAALAVAEGERRQDRVVDAIGPETFTYRDLVRRIGSIIGKPRPIVSVPRWLGLAVGWLLGKLVGDVMITGDEIDGLTSDLLYTTGAPAGPTRFTDWAEQNAATLGAGYASELARRRDRTLAYASQ
ncbi:MAG: NAD(P)H-binding protein [Deltaproteobacteria bacterium]|nr:NAD(P)H-binding protein [Deltaproteobacteria bacterium]